MMHNEKYVQVDVRVKDRDRVIKSLPPEIRTGFTGILKFHGKRGQPMEGLFCPTYPKNKINARIHMAGKSCILCLNNEIFDADLLYMGDPMIL